MEVVVDQANSAYKCGCGKVYPTMKAWTGHLARGRTPECSAEPSLIVNLPDPPGDDDELIGPAPPDHLEAPSATTRTSRAGIQVEDPVPPKGRAAIMGDIAPSTLKESVSFPVYARMMYDAWRQHYGTTRSFGEWTNLCLLVFWKRIGLQLALVVRDPQGAPQYVEVDVAPETMEEIA